jgi:signal transduction histidine kinase
MEPRRLSTTTRLAGVVGLAFLLAFAVLGGFAYFAVSSLLYQDAREVIHADAEGLTDLYRHGGRPALLVEVEQRVAAPDDPDALYAVIERATGRRVAGNLDAPPRGNHARWIRRQGTDDPALPQLLYQRPLDRDLLLITGLRLRSESGFLAMSLRAATMATLLAVALGLLLGGLIARWVSHRLRRLEETVARVGEGALASRVPLDGSGDAFELLALRFNRMLDRIEILLSGVREATDHIAHDLRTPLTRLRSRLEHLRADVRVPRATLESAIAEVDQLLQSSSALLRLARLEAQAPADTDPDIALEPLVRDAIELYEPIAAERRIALVQSLEPARSRGDADQLFQMLINLLDNAIKYSPADSEIRVSLRCDAGGAHLEIADRGGGIPAGERERVFDRFHRLERHRGSPGSGLGLSLVRAIVHRHRGQIRLEDHRPGLRVCVLLPPAG